MFRPIAPPNPTGCEACARAERPPQAPLTVGAAWLAGTLAVLLTGYRRTRRPTVAQLLVSQASMIAAMLGGGGVAAEVTGYERHRQAWIQTGDRIEIERMLRHPLPPQPEHRHKRPPPARRLGGLALAVGLAAAGILAVMVFGLLVTG